MPWAKLDDKFHSHPKVMELELPEIGLWTLAASWCADYLTDGEIKRGQIRRLGGSDELAQKLVEACLWEPTEDGWQFRDWADYQPTRASVEQEREAKRLAGLERAHNRWHLGRGVTAPDCELCNKNGTPDSSSYSSSIAKECGGDAGRASAAPSMRTGSHSSSPAGDAHNKKDGFDSSSYSSPIAEPYLTDAPEPEPEPNINNSSRAHAHDDEFGGWWQHYPKKVDKGRARKAFKAARKKASLEKLTEAAEQYAISTRNTERQYIKNPATWLNAEAWENEPEHTTQPPKSYIWD